MTERLEAYRAICANKRPTALANGLPSVNPRILDCLFPAQAHGVEFAVRAGRSALFYDTGMGKTRMMLRWAQAIVEYTNRPVLMLAPLAVGSQHVREAEACGVEAVQSRLGAPPSKPCVAITNYQRLEKFDPNDFAGVVLDESSILKSFSGVTTRQLIEAFSRMPYRLAGTATPAPNDYTELGQHSAFLGVMAQSEMLSRWFLHDTANTKDWRLKGHAIETFWDWVASWARCVSKPSDLGFSDEGFRLPPLNVVNHVVEADRTLDVGEEKDGQGRLFRIPDRSATAIHKEKRLTCDARAAIVAQIVAKETGPVCIWVDTDYEADAVKKVLPTCAEVSGKMKIEVKEETLDMFARGDVRILLTKPKIAGFGLNWQHCNTAIYAGLSFSYESFYQSLRRFYRFGQKRPVTAHIVCADTELQIAAAVSRKGNDHEKMKSEMAAAMMRACQPTTTMHTYNPTKEGRLPSWLA